MRKMLLIILSVSNYLFSYTAKHILQIINKIKSKEVVIASGVDCRGASSLLKGQNLSAAQLSGMNFNKNTNQIVPLIGTVKIPNQNTDISNGNFSDCDLISASFKGANAQNTNFDGADILWADFSGANLKGAQFNGTKNISKARFYNAIMPDGTKLEYGSWTDGNGSVFNAYHGKKE